MKLFLILLLILTLNGCDDADVNTMRYGKNLISLDSTLIGDGTIISPLGVNLDSIKSIISDSLSTVGGGGVVVDDFVALFYGTNDGEMLVFNDFENYSIDTIIKFDVGSYQIDIVNYDYGTQDDFTWTSATPHYGGNAAYAVLGPSDVFLAPYDAVILQTLDLTGSPVDLNGYIYIEIRIYSSAVIQD